MLPCQQRWGWVRVWEENGQESWPKVAKKMSYILWGCIQRKMLMKARKQEECPFSQITTMCDGPCFPGKDCQGEEVNELLGLLSLDVQFLLCVLKYLYLSPCIFALLPFQFLAVWVWAAYWSQLTASAETTWKRTFMFREFSLPW